MRFAVRTLLRTPGFTFAAVSSLAFGLALIASTLSVVNAYLIRSLPYPEADRLYHVVYARPGQPEPRGLSALDWKTLDDIVEVADSSAGTRFYLVDGAYTQEAAGLLVAPGSLESLGVHAEVGRSLEPGDFREGAESVALIGHALWRERFGSDRQVIGRLFRANMANQAAPTQTFRIIGVLPPAFRYVREYARAPMEIVAPLKRRERTYMVRLREGVPPVDAERRITEAVRQVSGAQVSRDWPGVRLESVHERYVGTLRPMLIAITTAAALVLAIVLANVGILTLLRAMRRQKEIAVRLALGASRTHIVRLVVAEACVICAAALLAGLTLTAFTLSLLAPLIEAQLGQPAPGGPSALAIDTTVLTIVAGIGVLAVFSLAFLPLLTPWRCRLSDSLRRDTRSGTDTLSMRWARAGLMVLEMAGSLALLVGCGLMIRSVVNLVRTDLGIQSANVVRTRVALPARTYADPPAFLQFYERFTDHVSARTNATVAFTNFPPLVEPPKQQLEIEGGPASGLTAGVLAVSPGFMETVGIPMLQGRAFTRADRIGSEPVVVISETLARRLWPGGNAVGRRIRTAEQPVANAPMGAWRTVVGVARDIRQTVTDEDASDVYLPFYQAPTRFAPVLIRTDGQPSAWLDVLRRATGEIDPEVLIGNATLLEEEAGRQLAGTRFLTSIVTGFAAFAGLLVLLGIYGVTAYAVQQRESEVAIRMTLGATRGEVVGLFLKQSGVVIAIGLVAGLFAAYVVAGTLEHRLHGVRTFDLPTLVTMCVLLGGGALLATWWPARHAATRNPGATLKEL